MFFSTGANRSTLCALALGLSGLIACGGSDGSAPGEDRTIQVGPGDVDSVNNGPANGISGTDTGGEGGFDEVADNSGDYANPPGSANDGLSTPGRQGGSLTGANGFDDTMGASTVANNTSVPGNSTDNTTVASVATATPTGGGGPVTSGHDKPEGYGPGDSATPTGNGGNGSAPDDRGDGSSTPDRDPNAGSFVWVVRCQGYMCVAQALYNHSGPGSRRKLVVTHRGGELNQQQYELDGKRGKRNFWIAGPVVVQLVRQDGRDRVIAQDTAEPIYPEETNPTTSDNNNRDGGDWSGSDATSNSTPPPPPPARITRLSSSGSTITWRAENAENCYWWLDGVSQGSIGCNGSTTWPSGSYRVAFKACPKGSSSNCDYESRTIRIP